MRKDQVLESVSLKKEEGFKIKPPEQHEWQEGNDEQAEKHPAVIHHMPLMPVQ